jgi:DNA-binding NarL/FixJ family response regulator
MMNKIVGGSPNVGVSAIERLSDRELEVFSLIGQGYGTRKIAERLHLSIKTIETYRAHIKDKLSLTDATELLQYAIRWCNSQTEE